MEDFERSDSGELERTLTDEEVRFFEGFGFVVLRQHFTAAEMATIDSELAHAVDLTFADRPFDGTIASSESLQEVELSKSTTPFIYSLPEGPHFYGIGKQLFGEDAIGHESSAVLYAGDTRWHADRSGPDVQISKFRPALAAGRLRIIDAARLSFALKTPWSNGTTHLVLSPLELLEKLAALVPPPRLNLIRYHGLLAPSAGDRAQIVPGAESEPQTRSAWRKRLAPIACPGVN